MKSDGETHRTVECINTVGKNKEHSDMKRNGKTCRNDVHIDTVGKDYFDKKSDDGTNRLVDYITLVDKENFNNVRDNKMNQDAKYIKKGHHEGYKDAGNVKSGCNKNCYNLTTEFHIDASGCILSAHKLEPIAGEIKLSQSPDRTEYEGTDDQNTLIENEYDFHPEAKSVKSSGKADVNKHDLKQIPAKKKAIRNKGSRSKQEDSDLRSLQQIKDDFKKTIIDLIDVYESNPGLQKIEKKDKRLLKRRKVLAKDNALKPVPIMRGHLRIRRKQCFTIKPLSPKITRISKGVYRPRHVIQRRQNLEREIQNNVDNLRQTEDALEKLKLKCIKTENRFKKSEFELLPSSMMHLSDAVSQNSTRSGTFSDACTTTVSVAEVNSKTDKDVSQSLSTSRVSEGRTSVKVFLKPEEPKITSPGLEDDSKVC